MRLVRHISFILMVCAASFSYGQSWTGQAYEFYKAKNYDNAKAAIDSAITTSERFDSQTWQLRGIIYRNLSDGDQLYYREIALESFVRAQKIDSTGIYKDKIDDYLRNTIVRYYNDAVRLLTEQKEFEKAEESYNTYKIQYKKLLDPNFDFSESDIEFYTALGAEYLAKADLVVQSEKNALREKSLAYCLKVLQIDSLSRQANYNAGIVYYNIGVDLIMNVDPEITLEELVLNQKRAEEAFLKALPYLHRAEQLNSNQEVKTALMGCYYGLNNNEMYLKYQTTLDKENLPRLLQQHKQDPTNIKVIKEIIRIYTYTLINEEEAERFRNILYNLSE